MTFEEYKKQYNISLNEQQEKAVQSVKGNILLLAVPGSGKTTVLVARLGYMICACGIAPENILTMTYTVAAANDMKARFINKFGDEYADKLVFKTINAVCLSIIRRYTRMKGTGAFELIEEGDRAALLSGLFKDINNEWPTEAQKRTLSSDITYIKNMMFKHDEILELKGEGYSNLPKIYDRYNEELKKMKRMDFDDQLIYTYSILTKYPEIRDKFRSQYKYICVDEAQDTSKIQHEIIRLLATGNNETGNYFAVGDEDQSIYGFRAAYPEALYSFEKTYSNAQVLLLEKNYRSTKAIVSSAASFINKNSKRHPKTMIANSDEEGEQIDFVSFRTPNDQYGSLVRIAKDCNIQTAILFHDNDSSIPIIDLLDREKIGYRARGLDSFFFSNPIVIDIVGIIKFVLGDCKDREFFEKNYYKIGLYLNKNQAELALKLCPVDENIVKFISVNKQKKFPENIAQNAYSRLLGCNMIRNSVAGADNVLSAIEMELGYRKYLERLKKPTGVLRILDQLAKKELSAARFIARLDELKTIIAAGGTDSKSNFILSTVHSSKGLEYDRVIIIDAYEGYFPKADKNEQCDEYEEERRLFYVAMTRAKKELILYTYRCYPCVFQDEVQTDIIAKQRELGANSRHAPKVIRGKFSANTIEDKLFPGKVIIHNMFGRGTVTERLNDKQVLIEFSQGFKKSLAVEILLKNRLIVYADE